MKYSSGRIKATHLRALSEPSSELEPETPYHCERRGSTAGSFGFVEPKLSVVRRANADADARGVVVALTDAGVARLTETAPVHLHAVSELFVAQLDDQELAALKNALDKVAVDCTFG